MNIGEAAARSGVSPKSIRYYESVGLIDPAARADNGYRDYGETDVQMLRFVQRARGLGFSVAEVAELLSLYQDKGRASADVKRVTLRHIADIEAKIAALKSMRSTLAHLAEHCHGDERPDCPILDDLAGEGAGHNHASGHGHRAARDEMSDNERRLRKMEQGDPGKYTRKKEPDVRDMSNAVIVGALKRRK